VNVRLAGIALMLGNVVVGLAVLAPAGMLQDLAAGLSVSLKDAGLLIAIGGAVATRIRTVGGLVDGRVQTTGSMAETVFGNHKDVTCPACGHQFAINCSREVEPSESERPMPTFACVCPNCRQHIHFPTAPVRHEVEYPDSLRIADPGIQRGDRFLANRQVREAWNVAREEVAFDPLLEHANADHHSQQRASALRAGFGMHIQQVSHDGIRSAAAEA